MAGDAVRPIWLCPRCGARLATRNLSHSCVKVTLEELFGRSTPEALELARTYVGMLLALGDVQVIAQKTRLVAVARVRFAGLEPRRDGFMANFALHRWLDSPRIAKRVDYGPTWRRHEVLIRTPADLDEELRSWLQESHDVAGKRVSTPRGSGGGSASGTPGSRGSAPRATPPRASTSG